MVAVTSMSADRRVTLRGSSLANILNRFGSSFRRRPDSLPIEERGELFRLSQPVQTLDFFFSHSWASSGCKKYLAFLWYSMGGRALWIGMTAGTLVFYYQELFHALPGAFMTDTFWGLGFTVSYAEYIVTFAVAWSILLAGTSMRYATFGFLDCTCVNQTDEASKVQGIMELPFAVAAAKEFIVAWDLNYFKRGWCAYEFAMAVSWLKKDNITFLPIGMFFMLTSLHVLKAIAGMFYLVTWPMLSEFGGQFSFVVSTVLLAVPAGIVEAAMGTQLAMEQQVLYQDLRNFQMCSTQFAEEADRLKVYKHIEDMTDGGLQAFDFDMRNKVLKFVTDNFFSQRAAFPYSTVFVSNFAGMALATTIHSSFRDQAPPFFWTDWVQCINFTFFMLPTTSAVNVALGHSWSQASSKHWDHEDAEDSLRLASLFSRWENVLASLISSCFLLFMIMFTWRIPCLIAAGKLDSISRNPWHGLGLALLMTAINATIAAYFFWPRSSVVEELNVKEQTRANVHELDDDSDPGLSADSAA